MGREKLPVNDLVIVALETAIQAELPCRFVKSGQKAGLFVTAKGPAASAAVASCRDSSLNLLMITVLEEKKGKNNTQVEYATITREGIQVLFEVKSVEQREDLLEKCATSHKEVAYDIHTDLLQNEIESISEQSRLLEQRADHLFGLLEASIQDRIAKIEASKALLGIRHAKLMESLEGKAALPRSSNVVKVAAVGATVPPQTDADLDFQMHVCRELVFAWQDASDPELRASLEPAMLNVGLEPVSEIGDRVSFDNRDHRTNDDLVPGQAAVVVEKGWQLTSPRGTRLISPAQVSPVFNEGGTIDAAHVER